MDNLFITPLTPHLHTTLKARNPAWQQAFEQLPLERADAILVLNDGVHADGWISLWWQKIPEYHGDIAKRFNFGYASASCRQCWSTAKRADNVTGIKVIGYKTAYIGTYNVPTPEMAQKLLTHAEKMLRQQGCGYVIAPVDGDTWHGYRLTTRLYDAPPFFLDRITPLEWNQHFTDAGFGCIANYASACAEELDYSETAAPYWQEKFNSDPQYTLQPFDLEKTDAQLQELYALSLQGFKDNFLYSDITQAEFVALYQPIIPFVVPELVQLAYIRGQLAAFAFAVPDYAQKARGEEMDTLVLKTVVRHPAPEFKGLGAYLVWRMHQTAKAQGYRKLVTAFMHENNVSLALSLKAGRIIREYALYGKQL